MNTLAKRIKACRKQLGLNQTELARKVDPEKGQSFISNIETGRREETPYIPEFAHIFGVDAYWLKTGKGDPQPWKAAVTDVNEAAATVQKAAEPENNNLVPMPRTLLKELEDIASKINDTGLHRLIGTANQLAIDYPIIKQTPASSQ